LVAWAVPGIILGLLAGAFAVFVGLLLLPLWLFARASGWLRIIDRYGPLPKPAGVRSYWQTIKVGGVRWPLGAVAGISERGLYLAPAVLSMPTGPLAGMSFVLIPWHEIRRVGPGRIYLSTPATELAIGNPQVIAITVHDALYEMIAPFLANVPPPPSPMTP